MDTLTSVLSVLRLEPRFLHRLNLTSGGGVEILVSHGATFHIVMRGDCWLLQNHADPIHLEQGDIIVLTNVACYALVDDPHTPTQSLDAFLQWQAVHPPEDATAPQLIYGELQTERRINSPLFAVLPSLIHLRGRGGTTVGWFELLTNSIETELEGGLPGSGTIVSRLMDIFMIMVIRHWILDQLPEQSGWFGALYHPQLGKVLALIHQEPHRAWTVDMLAAEVYLSRSALAALFTSLIGEPPMKYLTRWRMHLGAMWLMDNPKATVEEIAQRLGYSSSFAFSKAFKRLVGLSPADFRSHSFAADFRLPLPQP